MTNYLATFTSAQNDLGPFTTANEATEAIALVLGWANPVVSETFPVSETADAYCVYETQDDHDADIDGAMAPRVMEISSRSISISLSYNDSGTWIDANDPIDNMDVSADLTDDEITAAVVTALDSCGEYDSGLWRAEWACGCRSGWADFGEAE